MPCGTRLLSTQPNPHLRAAVRNAVAGATAPQAFTRTYHTAGVADEASSAPLFSRAAQGDGLFLGAGVVIHGECGGTGAGGAGREGHSDETRFQRIDSPGSGAGAGLGHLKIAGVRARERDAADL